MVDPWEPITEGAALSSDNEATITAYPDGPYLIRGSYRVLDVDGNELEVARRTIALCRCGRSSQKPLCDGSHRSFNFKDPIRRDAGRPASLP
ncbi:MAG TPA: CDGSH iron-sulfur domain-containing protein [Actinomycetota bacterium]|nr:CDGSH iron-sulfur domain-containing protein [Actinomycetota bacterium]